MPLNRKPGLSAPKMNAEAEYPDVLMPPLPESVKKRFPELSDWERTASENYSKLIDVLLRRDREVLGSINEP